MTTPPRTAKSMEEAVLDVIELDLGIPRSIIHKNADLVKDLKIDTDDLSFLFVPALEKMLGKKIEVSEWDDVFTVQDAINLLVRHSGSSPHIDMVD